VLLKSLYLLTCRVLGLAVLVCRGDATLTSQLRQLKTTVGTALLAHRARRAAYADRSPGPFTYPASSPRAVQLQRNTQNGGTVTAGFLPGCRLSWQNGNVGGVNTGMASCRGQIGDPVTG
jgi:hypothetical protein